MYAYLFIYQHLWLIIHHLYLSLHLSLSSYHYFCFTVQLPSNHFISVSAFQYIIITLLRSYASIYLPGNLFILFINYLTVSFYILCLLIHRSITLSIHLLNRLFTRLSIHASVSICLLLPKQTTARKHQWPLRRRFRQASFSSSHTSYLTTRPRPSSPTWWRQVSGGSSRGRGKTKRRTSRKKRRRRRKKCRKIRSY